MHTKTTKQEQWEQIIAAWETSGLSQKIFCQEQGYSQGQFRYWRKITRAQETDGQDTADGARAAIQLSCYQISQPAHGVAPESPLETQGITVAIGGSATLTISGCLSIGQLAKIMAACAIPNQAETEKEAPDVSA